MSVVISVVLAVADLSVHGWCTHAMHAILVLSDGILHMNGIITIIIQRYTIQYIFNNVLTLCLVSVNYVFIVYMCVVFFYGDCLLHVHHVVMGKNNPSDPPTLLSLSLPLLSPLPFPFPFPPSCKNSYVLKDQYGWLQILTD